jgi:transporter family-2 protein
MAAGAGIALAVQPTLNAQIARAAGSPFTAGLISLTVSALIMLAVTTVMTQGRINLPAVFTLPWYVPLLGGLMGVIFVTTSLFLVPRIGVGSVFAFVIAGQVIAAALIDHFGLLGVAERELTAGRLMGFALVAAGAIMVKLL